MSMLEFDFAFRGDGQPSRARLFPLPNLVMFPHVMQPLHVFEPRYRELLADALAGDRMIAMALLKPGWEADYEGRPPIYPVVCMTGILLHHPLDDGRSNVLLAGLQRMGVVRELPPERSYREAEVLLLGDDYAGGPNARWSELGRRVIDRFRGRMPNLQEQFDEILTGDVPLDKLTDVLAFTLKFDLAIKEQLLREANVERRATLILEALETLEESEQTGIQFPPDFSAN